MNTSLYFALAHRTQQCGIFSGLDYAKTCLDSICSDSDTRKILLKMLDTAAKEDCTKAIEYARDFEQACLRSIVEERRAIAIPFIRREECLSERELRIRKEFATQIANAGLKYIRMLARATRAPGSNIISWFQRCIFG